jgi:hypothetical protein
MEYTEIKYLKILLVSHRLGKRDIVTYASFIKRLGQGLKSGKPGLR